MSSKFPSLLILILTPFVLWGCTTQASEIPDLPTEPVTLEVNHLIAEDPVTVEDPVASEEEDQMPKDPNTLEGVARFFTDEGNDYMRTYLLEPSEDLNGFVDEDMMSRCGSGASYALNTKPTTENPYFLGTVSLTKGCDQFKHFFDFRVSPDGQTLEISNIEQNQYVPYKEWFKTAKPVEFESLKESEQAGP